MLKSAWKAHRRDQVACSPPLSCDRRGSFPVLGSVLPGVPHPVAPAVLSTSVYPGNSLLPSHLLDLFVDRTSRRHSISGSCLALGNLLEYPNQQEALGKLCCSSPQSPLGKRCSLPVCQKRSLVTTPWLHTNRWTPLKSSGAWFDSPTRTKGNRQGNRQRCRGPEQL